MQRDPEPELMDDAAQALAYARADFSAPHERFVGLLCERTRAHELCGVALDLGCGPGDITFRVARALWPASEAAAHAFVAREASSEPELLRRDFYLSLCAAYALQEVRAQLAGSGLAHFALEAVSDRHFTAYGALLQDSGRSGNLERPVQQLVAVEQEAT